MKTLTASAALALALAASACGSSANNDAAPKIGIANPGSDRLKGLSPLNRRICLQNAIRGNRKTCNRVIAGAYQEQYGERAMWVALCEDGHHWAVYISPNEDVEVRDCAEAEQLRLPVCHPVMPMPHDPTAAPGTEVPANTVEAANRNLTGGR
jgi:hypothetical protein